MATIKSTRDYNIFKLIKGNRIPKEKDIVTLTERIKVSGIVDPICVNEKMQVIDGQHRLEACKRLNIPISYYVNEGADMSTVHAVNSQRKNWTNTNYAESYCALGKEDYKIYSEFREKYKITHEAAMVMLTGQYTDTKIDSKFAKGEMKIVNLKKATDIAEKLMKLGEFYKGYLRRSFIFAFVHCYRTEGFDYSRLHHKMAQLSRKMVDCPNTKMYIELLEEVYNWKADKKNKLSFRN